MNPMRKRRGLSAGALSALAIAVAVAAGCGGSGGSGGDGGNGSTGASTTTGPSKVDVTTSSLSKAAFLKQANAICTRGVERVQKAFSSEASEAAQAEAVAAFTAMVGEAVGEIQQLGAPKGDEAAVQATLTALQKAVDTSEEESASTLERLAALFRKSDALAGSYGLNACVF